MPMKVVGEVFKAAGSVSEAAGLGDPVFGPTGETLTKYSLFEESGQAIGETFSPSFPEVETPDPVAQQSALASAQSEERSLINRAGLQTTKKVQTSLLQNQQRQKLGA